MCKFYRIEIVQPDFLIREKQGEALDELLGTRKTVKWYVKWYEAVKCRYTSDTQTPIDVYLPMAFLKMKGLLPQDINLEEEREYKLNFQEFKIDKRNIDELFLKKPTYVEMLKYCRYLYRKNTSRLNDYAKETDQAMQQFTNEFKDF